LPRFQFDDAGLEIDKEDSFEDEDKFVVVIVLVQ